MSLPCPAGDRVVARDPLAVPVLALFVVACLLILSTVHTGDPDLWGHVVYGQEALAAGRLPATATHTYTAPAHPWINHENASEIVFAILVNRFGPAGLTGLTIALGASVVLAFVSRAIRAGVRVPALLAVVLLAVCNMTPGWSVRPQVFTYGSFALLLVLLDGAFAAPGRRWLLWTVPPLFAVWANTHGGFLAGLGVLVVYLGVSAAGATRREALGMAAVVVLAVLATLVNPYGIRLLTWLVEDLRPPRPEISEWGRMMPPDPVFFVFAALVLLTVFALVRTRRRRDWAHVAVLAVTACEAVAHSRHVVFFGIAAGLFVPVHLDDVWSAPASRDAPAPGSVRRMRAVAWSMAGVFLAVLLFLCRTLWVSKAAYPVDAFQYLADRGVAGRIVADFGWAQYALAAFPESSVAFDGRLRTSYPQDVADAYFDFLLGDLPGMRWRSPTSPPFDDRRILRLGNPDMVLLGRGEKHALKVMARATSEWVLLYEDGVAQIWGRRSVYDDPRSARYLAPGLRSVSRRRPDGWVRWPAFPARQRSRQRDAAAVSAAADRVGGRSG